MIDSMEEKTSPAWLTSIGMTSRPSVRAVVATSRISIIAPGAPEFAMTASRASLGSTSRNNSIRLPAVSVCWIDMPVTLPPGRARLATTPAPTGSICAAEYDWYRRCGALCGKHGRGGPGDDDVDLAIGQLGRDFAVALGARFRPVILDCDIASFGPAEFAEPFDECCHPWTGEFWGRRAQKSDCWPFRGLLGPRRGRQDDGCTSASDEIPPPHPHPRTAFKL